MFEFHSAGTSEKYLTVSTLYNKFYESIAALNPSTSIDMMEAANYFSVFKGSEAFVENYSGTSCICVGSTRSECIHLFFLSFHAPPSNLLF